MHRNSPDSSRSKKDGKPREREQSSSTHAQMERRSIPRHDSHDTRHASDSRHNLHAGSSNKKPRSQKGRKHVRSSSTSSSSTTESSRSTSTTTSSTDSDTGRKRSHKSRGGHRKSERSKDARWKKHSDTKRLPDPSKTHQVIGKQPLPLPPTFAPPSAFAIPPPIPMQAGVVSASFMQPELVAPTGMAQLSDLQDSILIMFLGQGFIGSANEFFSSEPKTHALSPPPPMPMFEPATQYPTAPASSTSRKFSRRTHRDSESTSSSSSEDGSAGDRRTLKTSATPPLSVDVSGRMTKQPIISPSAQSFKSSELSKQVNKYFRISKGYKLIALFNCTYKFSKHRKLKNER